MKIYILKQIIRKLINSSYYHIKKLLKNTTKVFKLIITIILILMLIKSFSM